MTTTPNSTTEFSPLNREGLVADEAVRAIDSLAKVNSREADEAPVDDPWAAYGNLGGEQTQIVGVAPELPAVALSTDAEVISENTKDVVSKGIGEVVTSFASSLLDYQAEMRKITEARFDTHINRAAISSILSDHPELLRYRKPGKPSASELQRQAELQGMLDKFAMLPEDLYFEPGLTLIVGENGAGKSTLNRALQIALDTRVAYLKGLGGKDFAEFKAKRLEPDKFESPIGVTIPSIFSLLIAEQIDVSDLASFGSGKYFDATSVYGFSKAAPMIPRGGIDTDIFDSLALSHSQSIDDILFGYLRYNKDGYKSSLERFPDSRDTGPEVIFLDEVENGLSPKNHRNIKAKISEHVIEGSIVLCATNSAVLYYDPTLPRIDLEYPELGIHKPIEHPEVYDLSEFTER